MKCLLALLLLPLALMACGKGADSGTPSAPASPVAPVVAPKGQDWLQVVSKTPEGGYVVGNPDAPIKLLEYGSRTCPTCGAFGRTAMQPLENMYVKSGKVSYEYRDFLVHGPPDLPASLLGRCVGTATFFAVLEAMYQGQAPFEEKLSDQTATAALQQKLVNAPGPAIANGWADYMGFVDFMKQRGLPEAKARACLNDQAAIDQLTKMMDDAGRAPYNVTGTPSFYINGKKLDTALSWPDVEQALRASGA
ncbi:thioredoxin domain-containing protein [uncultured Sphingomonas sp.]|uniref:thioredoxin domain-containing protein n=1 Tax=uncultured Sphingomonas sp. TaxID=158754 RepID=UPI0035CAEC43